MKFILQRADKPLSVDKIAYVSIYYYSEISTVYHMGYTICVYL